MENMNKRNYFEVISDQKTIRAPFLGYELTDVNFGVKMSPET